ncbi:MAG: hypothetical protein NC898_04935 [Candidatus Omnitrophica bacterium]|nr:hypothetical protein [Candidatus Omnitrophota bacterium]MCM8793792.1 hypothetical protein [Candidatus Omnitrophota bacterium]
MCWSGILLFLFLRSRTLSQDILHQNQIFRRIRLFEGIISPLKLSSGREMKQEELLEHLNKTGPVLVGIEYYKTGKKDYLLILAHKKHLFGDNEFIYQFLSEIGTDETHVIKEEEFFGFRGPFFGWDYNYYWLKEKTASWAKKLVSLNSLSDKIKVIFGGNGRELAGIVRLEKFNFSGKEETVLTVNTENFFGVTDLFRIYLPLSGREKSLLTLTSLLSFYFDYQCSEKDRNFPRIWIEFYDAQNKQIGSKHLRDFSDENKFFKIPLKEIISFHELNKEAYLVVAVRFSSPGLFYMKDVEIE